MSAVISLKTHCKDPFSLTKNTVPTLNEVSHCIHLFYATMLRPPESFERLNSMTKK